MSSPAVSRSRTSRRSRKQRSNDEVTLSQIFGDDPLPIEKMSWDAVQQIEGYSSILRSSVPSDSSAQHAERTSTDKRFGRASTLSSATTNHSVEEAKLMSQIAPQMYGAAFTKKVTEQSEAVSKFIKKLSQNIQDTLPETIKEFPESRADQLIGLWLETIGRKIARQNDVAKYRISNSIYSAAQDETRANLNSLKEQSDHDLANVGIAVTIEKLISEQTGRAFEEEYGKGTKVPTDVEDLRKLWEHPRFKVGDTKVNYQIATSKGDPTFPRCHIVPQHTLGKGDDATWHTLKYPNIPLFNTYEELESGDDLKGFHTAAFDIPKLLGTSNLRGVATLNYMENLRDRIADLLESKTSLVSQSEFKEKGAAETFTELMRFEKICKQVKETLPGEIITQLNMIKYDQAELCKRLMQDADHVSQMNGSVFQDLVDRWKKVTVDSLNLSDCLAWSNAQSCSAIMTKAIEGESDTHHAQLQAAHNSLEQYKAFMYSVNSANEKFVEDFGKAFDPKEKIPQNGEDWQYLFDKYMTEEQKTERDRIQQERIKAIEIDNTPKDQGAYLRGSRYSGPAVTFTERSNLWDETYPSNC